MGRYNAAVAHETASFAAFLTGRASMLPVEMEIGGIDEPELPFPGKGGEDD
jgi:hypothetical protein